MRGIRAAALALALAAGGALAPAPARAESAAKPQGAEPRPPAAKAEAEPERPNGFDLGNAVVARAEIVRGGPPRDGIRSIDAPRFVPEADATWVDDATPVLGVVVAGDARAYPVHLMDYHQIANDVVGGVPLAVTWDPLTGAPLAFERTVDGRMLTFGVSGLLYNSGFLMYDRETESLWSQFLGRALAGPLAGKTLRRVRIRQEDLTSWRTRVGRTRVLERPEPTRIDYRFSPFERYLVEDAIRYPVKARDERFHAKELVLGVVAGGKARAYLGSVLTAEGGWAEDVFQGRRIQIDYSTELSVFRWEAPADVEVTEAYWFAWKAFHPDTEVWKKR
jgi:hypothetical protein